MNRTAAAWSSDAPLRVRTARLIGSSEFCGPQHHAESENLSTAALCTATSSPTQGGDYRKPGPPVNANRKGPRGWREIAATRASVRASCHQSLPASPAGLFDGLFIELSDGVPIDHVEERRDVIGTAVLVVQVVGVLPDVDAQDRRAASPSAGCPGSACSRRPAFCPLSTSARPSRCRSGSRRPH